MNLSDYSFYNGLKTSDVDFLHKHLRPIKIAKGNILFYQSDICKDILFLTKGEVKIYIQSKEADEITLYKLQQGEQCIVNTASTLSQTAAIGSAVTLTDIEGYLLDVQSVKKLAHMSDAYQNFLFEIYTLRMGSLADLINDIKFKKLDERVMKWLQAKQAKRVKTTHEEIAYELGSTRAVISRVLKELEKKAKVILHRGEIELV